MQPNQFFFKSPSGSGPSPQLLLRCLRHGAWTSVSSRRAKPIARGCRRRLAIPPWRRGQGAVQRRRWSSKAPWPPRAAMERQLRHGDRHGAARGRSWLPSVERRAVEMSSKIRPLTLQRGCLMQLTFRGQRTTKMQFFRHMLLPPFLFS
jgi:hypothetical protein